MWIRCYREITNKSLKEHICLKFWNSCVTDMRTKKYNFYWWRTILDFLFLSYTYTYRHKHIHSHTNKGIATYNTHNIILSCSIRWMTSWKHSPNNTVSKKNYSTSTIKHHNSLILIFIPFFWQLLSDDILLKPLKSVAIVICVLKQWNILSDIWTALCFVCIKFQSRNFQATVLHSKYIAKPFE